MLVSSVDSQRLGWLEGPPQGAFLQLSVVFLRRVEGRAGYAILVGLARIFPLFGTSMVG